MTYTLTLTLSLLFGGALSLMYFGGLWYTVRRMHHARRPKLLLIGSFIVRSAVALAGFYGVVQFMNQRWEMLALSLLGFMVGRVALVRRWRPHPAPSPSNT